jgi:oligopeptide/dipeptide ABC transporter ATP-binding protein
MYLGKIVEYSSTEDIFHNPMHPYSIALIASVAIPDPNRRAERAPLMGEVPSPVNPPIGCRFHTRCARAMEVCKKKEPALLDVGNGHFVACFDVARSSNSPSDSKETGGS